MDIAKTQRRTGGPLTLVRTSPISNLTQTGTRACFVRDISEHRYIAATITEDLHDAALVLRLSLMSC